MAGDTLSAAETYARAKGTRMARHPIQRGELRACCQLKWGATCEQMSSMVTWSDMEVQVLLAYAVINSVDGRRGRLR